MIYRLACPNDGTELEVEKPTMTATVYRCPQCGFAFDDPPARLPQKCPTCDRPCAFQDDPDMPGGIRFFCVQCERIVRRILPFIDQ